MIRTMRRKLLIGALSLLTLISSLSSASSSTFVADGSTLIFGAR